MNILIICKDPFGILIDAYYLCKYLSQNHDVTYIGLEQDALASNIEVKGVNLLNVPDAHDYWSNLRMLRNYASRAARGKYDLIYVYYFIGCSLLRIAHPGKKFILDIRSGCIAQSKKGRFKADMLMRLEAAFFSHRCLISEGLRDKLHFPRKTTRIVPLGANAIDTSSKSFRSLHLLYVGSLRLRHIEDTLLGFSRFHNEYSSRIVAKYTIIGGRDTVELECLRRIVHELKLDEHVVLLGYIPHDQLYPYFEECNVGVAYVPITDYYDHQPPTKTFEYLQAGMPVIATATSAHRQIISDINGILISDSTEEFYAGLKSLMVNLDNYVSRDIKSSAADYTWDSIMHDNLLPFVEQTACRTN